MIRQLKKLSIVILIHIGTIPAIAAPEKTPEIITLTLHPTIAMRPTDRYALLPNVTEQRPGNAAQLYMIAARTGPDETANSEILERLELRDPPMEELAKLDIPKELQPFATRLNLIDIAARREEARWDTTVREQGNLLRLPYLNDMRTNANILSQLVRWQIARHDWDAANHSLQTGFAMAGHLKDRPLIIQGLVEVGMLSLECVRVREWMCEPGAPNLYWPLTNLPQPMFDLHAMSQWEQGLLYFTFPQLDRHAHGEMSAKDWHDVFSDLGRLTIWTWTPKNDLGPVQLSVFVASQYAEARQSLLASGVPAAKVDAMPTDQVVGTYWLKQYEAAATEAWSTWELPYWEGGSRLHEPAPAPSERSEPPALENPLLSLIEPTRRARYHFAEFEQEVGALRIVEAIRDYASRHQNQFPATLVEITDLPLPIDAVSGKPYPYHLDGATATLELAPAMPNLPWPGTFYQMTIAH
jgi:hypothetical protein